MRSFCVKQIGTVHSDGENMSVELLPEFIPALKALDGFGHVNVIWWFDEFDGAEYRGVYESPKPYRNAPEVVGIFATRSPIRPNPIALTAARVIGIDHEKGIIQIAWIDANDGSPVLDIKPYTPSADRVEAPAVPDWCSHWPKSLEASEGFDWENEFLF